MNQAEEAFDIVKRTGLSVRSSAIAKRLDCTAANVHELLLPFVQRGALIACDVEAGGERLKDYRLSVAGGGKAPEVIYKARPPAQPKVTIFGMGKDEPEPDAAAPAAPAARPQPPKKQKPPAPPRQQPQENEVKKVSTATKILAVLEKHGSMTSEQVAERVEGKYVSTILSQMVKAGRLKKDSGRGGVYAIAGRRITAVARDEARASAPAVRAGTFRPSITCDGEIILTGAAAAGELNAAEVRVLAAFIQRMSAGIAA